jgi:hypothetical protein
MKGEKGKLQGVTLPLADSKAMLTSGSLISESHNCKLWRDINYKNLKGIFVQIALLERFLKPRDAANEKGRPQAATDPK